MICLHRWSPWYPLENDVYVSDFDLEGTRFGRNIAAEVRVCRKCKEPQLRPMEQTLDESRALLRRSIARRLDEVIPMDALTESVKGDDLLAVLEAPRVRRSHQEPNIVWSNMQADWQLGEVELAPLWLRAWRLLELFLVGVPMVVAEEIGKRLNGRPRSVSG